VVSPGKELRFAIAGDPKTFDPLQSSDSDSETIRYLTAGVLVRINRVTDTLERNWPTPGSGKTEAAPSASICAKSQILRRLAPHR